MKNLLLVIVSCLLLTSFVSAEKIYKEKSGTVMYKQNFGDSKNSIIIKHSWDDYGNLMSHSSEGVTTMPNGASLNVHNVLIIDVKNSKTWIIDHNVKTVMEMNEVTDQDLFAATEDENLSEESSDNALKPKKIASKTICGKKCDGIQIKEGKMWSWKGILMKQDMSDNGYKVSTIATKIKTGSVDKSDFSVPKEGYTDLSNALGAMGDDMSGMLDALQNMGMGGE